MADVLKPQLYDISTGKPVNLSEDKIPEAVASGRYGFLKGTQVPVIHPSGDTGTVPSESAAEAFRNGFTIEPAEAQLDRIKTAENAGALKGAAAFGAGAARGASFGLSDEILTHTGLAEPETLSDLEKYRPGWSMAGEAAGIIGSTALTPELGLTGAVSRIGKGAEVAAKTLGEAGIAATGVKGASRAAKVLAAANEIGAHAAGSAIEGAIYGGVGNTISEEALGDPDLNSQKVLANFGYGALLGGALGGTLKGASIGIPEGVTAAKEGLTKLKNTLIGTGEHDAGLLGRALPEKISEALANRSINLDVDEAMKLVDDTTSDLNGIHKNIETSMKKLNQDIRPQETEALIDTADPIKAKQAQQEVLGVMNDTIAVMRKERDLYSPNAVRKLEIQRDGLANKIKEDDSTNTIFQSMREAKQALKEMVFSKTPSTAEVDSMNLINQVGSKIDKTLKNPDIFGFAGAALAEHDNMLHDYYKYISPSARKPTDFQKAFMSKEGSGPATRWKFDAKKVERVLKTQETITGKQKLELLNGYYDTLKKLPEHFENTYASVPNERFESEQLRKIIENSEKTNTESAAKYLESVKNKKKNLGLGDMFAAHVAMTHPIIGAGIEAYNVITKPVEHLNKLAEVERLIGKATNAVGRGAKAIFNPTMALGDLTRNTIVKLSTEDNMKKHRALAEKLANFSSNPAALMEAVSSNTEALHNVAPNTSQALQQASIRATQFLASKTPFPKNDNQFSTKYEPSNMEMATFERYLNIAEKPISALEQVKNGTLIPETIETLNAIYPQLYDHMKQQVVEEATKYIVKNEPIPYRIKQSISHFIGQPLDESMTPQSIAANQLSYAQEDQQRQQDQAAVQKKTKPSVVGMRKIDLSQRTSNSRNDDV